MTRTITLEPLDASRLDTLDVDALVVPVLEHCAQPLGVAGYVDWRLCGRLAALIQSGRITGRVGELAILSYGQRVRPSRIFVAGLGPRGSCTAARGEAEMERLVQVLEDARVESVAIGAPLFDAASRVAHWLAAPALVRLSCPHVVILDADGALAAHISQLEQAANSSGWSFIGDRSRSG